MSRRVGYLLAAVLLVGSVGVAGLLVARRPEPARRNPEVHVPLAFTEPVQAGVGPVPVRGSGTVRPRAQVDIAAEVAGRVVFVAPGFVSGGRIARGDLCSGSTMRTICIASPGPRAQIAVQRVELLRVEEEARIARVQYERFSNRENAAAVGEAGPLALWEPQLEATRAAEHRARTAMAEAELGLSRAEVRAPFTGIVRTESIAEGKFVARGQPVGRLYASDVFEVVVPLADAEASLIPGLWAARAGDAGRHNAARVVADYGGPGYAWDGYVDRVDATLDEQTRTIDLIVHVPNRLAAGAPPGSAPAATGGNVTSAPRCRWASSSMSKSQASPRPSTSSCAARPSGPATRCRQSAGARCASPVRVLQQVDDALYVDGALRAGEPVVVGGIEVAVDRMAVRAATEGNP